MLKQFLNHIDQNKLFNKTDKILLAISGGVDSMVMLHLFKQSGFSVGVVHCNFQLRGDESDGDALLVKNICASYGINIHIKDFDTKAYADEYRISIQMAARTLRYDYFHVLGEQNGYSHIATAHHLNDSLETVLLNMVRGTGISGLTGIPVKQQNIVRPLLFATRAMIEEYAKSNQLLWREDTSNLSDKYYRNLLRNQVVPLLRKINPSLEETFQHSIERLQGTSLLANEALHQFRKMAIRVSDQGIFINKDKLALQPAPAVVLWELIKDKGLNYIQCKEIMATDHQSGKTFYSDTHQLTIDREALIITPKAKVLTNVVQIKEEDLEAERGGVKLMCKIVKIESFILNKELSRAQLDLDLLSFPLTWRNWSHSDKFTPLGMTQKKKLSDFLIDLKVSIPDKDKVTVIESAGEIVWVVGYRISEKFKVTAKTAKVFAMAF